MNNKILWQILGGAVILVVLFLGFVSFTGTSENGGEELGEARVTLSIEGLYDNKPVIITTHDAVLHVLQTLDVEDENLGLATKEYSGLGILVEGMAGKRNGEDNKYWQYMINDLMPQIGADKYKLHDGDDIVWEFKESEF